MQRVKTLKSCGVIVSIVVFILVSMNTVYAQTEDFQYSVRPQPRLDWCNITYHTTLDSVMFYVSCKQGPVTVFTPREVATGLEKVLHATGFNWRVKIFFLPPGEGFMVKGPAVTFYVVNQAGEKVGDFVLAGSKERILFDFLRDFDLVENPYTHVPGRSWWLVQTIGYHPTRGWELGIGGNWNPPELQRLVKPTPTPPVPHKSWWYF